MKIKDGASIVAWIEDDRERSEGMKNKKMQKTKICQERSEGMKNQKTQKTKICQSLYPIPTCFRSSCMAITLLCPELHAETGRVRKSEKVDLAS